MNIGIAINEYMAAEYLAPVIVDLINSGVSFAPALFAMTGFNAFNILLESVCNCPLIWAEMPCAAFKTVPQKKFRMIP